MAGKSAPAAPPDDTWIPAEKGSGSPAASPPKKKKSKGGPSSLRRAFSWLRGRRKKKQQKSQAGAPPAEGKKQEGRAKGKGANKSENDKRLSVQYKTGEGQPDNVFFPCNRPPHLEELHIQAQAGLKSLQNQEKQKQTKRTWDQSDSNSIQSSCSSTEGDNVSIQSKTPSCVTENSEDALSIRSEMIQRKGSTFRPHDSFPKSSMKGEKRRRERRTTVLGLPQHVQKELGLSNGYDSKKRPGSIAVRTSPNNVIHIPTVDGKLEPATVPVGGARVSLQALELEATSDCALQRHIDRIYYDDSLLGRKTAAKLSPLARPKSLAVPWMTTQPGSPELLRPVMSISPQGTYLSKIIPNAILPPTVDVIALSRNKVRTLSRCSLATASPASVRSLGRFSSAPRSREHSSSSDNWSHSQSTETIVSNTSTISSHGGTNSRQSEVGQDRQARTTARPDLDQLSAYSAVSGASSSYIKAAPASPNLLGVRLPGSSGRASPAYSTSSVADGSDTTSVRSDCSTSRSVSLRKMKKPPAPPRRTYSLHQKAQELEASGAPKAMGLPPKPERRPQRESSEGWAAARLGSHGPEGEDDVFPPSSQSEAISLQSDGLAYSADLSHSSPLPPDGQQTLPSKQGSPDHFGRTMSPSSGYSSQSGTPTLHTKGLLSHTSSPRSKRPQPKKPERVCSLQSPGPSVSSSLTSLSSSASDPAPAEMPPSGAAPALSKMDRFIIPPHPRVPAPFSPPPSKPQQAEPKTASSLPRASPSAGKADTVHPVLSKPSNGSPPPSPPPAYHPPPPPAKKADVSPDMPGASPTRPDSPQDALWPPPPPPVPDEHDLSMADFPPPEEAYFSSLPPPEAQPIAAETPSAEAPEGPAMELSTSQRAPSAEKGKEPTPSPSFSNMVSSKIQQQGVPHAAPLPAPKQEPLPSPKLSTVGEVPGSQHSHRKTSASAASQPSSLQTQPNLKKSAGGSRQDLKKESASRSKSNPMPKEDASLPIVTPSLLQMVRLRSINMDAHGPVASPAAAQLAAEQNGSGASGKSAQVAPQKPIRKSLSLKGPPLASREASSAYPLHNAVRLKASTLSSRDAPGFEIAERKARNRLTLPASATAATAAPGEAKDGQLSPLHKSPASTASFIFAKSSKKFVIETPSSPEAQANLKKNLVAELMNISSLRPTATSRLDQQGSEKPQAQKKPPKIPPPIAKKPLLGPGHLPSPQSPKPLGAEELSSSLSTVGERTKSTGTGNQASTMEAGRKSPPPSPEILLQSTPAQGVREEMA